MKSFYTFKNYLKYKLGLYYNTDEQIKKFIALNNQLKQFLSLENSILETDFQIDLENESCITKFFRWMDYNSNGPLFKIREKNVLKSSWGGIFTVNLVIGCILIFYYFGEDCWSRKNPLLSFTQFDIKNFTSNENLFNVPIMIGFSKSLAKYTKLVYFNRAGNFKYQDLETTICQDEDFKKFNVTLLDPDLLYYCSNYNQIFKNVTDLTNRLDSYIYFANCTELAEHNLNDTTCKGNSSPEYGSPMYFQLWMITKEFTNNYENFIYDKVDTLYKNLSYTDKVFNQFFSEHVLKFKKFSDDRNLLIYSREDSFFSSTLSIRQRNAELSTIPYAPNGKRIYVHSILIDPTYSSILRVYQKIDYMFARVMSMISILMFALVFINSYISDYNIFSNLKKEFIISLKEQDLQEIAKLMEVEKVDIEFLISQINFKNYLLHMLMIKNKGQIIFNDLYTRFKLGLSCNNFYIFKKIIKIPPLQINSEGINLIKKDNGDNLEEKYGSLENVDIFGETNYFYFENQKSFRTLEGGIISFFQLLVILFLIFFIGYDFWTSKIEDLQINQRSYYELTDEEKFNQIDCPYAVAFSKSVVNKLRLNLKNYTYVGSPPGAFQECSDEEYEAKFNAKKNISLYYLCGNLNYTLGNPLYDYSWQDKTLFIQSCSDMKITDKSTSNCDSDPKVDEKFRIEFKIKLKDLDLENYKLRDKIWTFHSDGTYKKMLKLNLYFRIYKITNYVNNIIFSPDTYQISTIQYFSSTNGQNSEFKIFFQTGQISIRLVYVNFPEFLAKVFGMIKILNFIINYIHYFVFEYNFKRSILRNILNFKDFEYSKELFKNKIKFKNPNINIIFNLNSIPDNYSEIKKDIKTHVFDYIYTFKNYTLMKIFGIKNLEYSYLDQKLNTLLSIERLFEINRYNVDNNQSFNFLKINPEEIKILKNLGPLQ